MPGLQLVRLSGEALEGFLALVFPLLLRRRDIAVGIFTRERKTTAYDVRVQVHCVGPSMLASGNPMVARPSAGDGAAAEVLKAAAEAQLETGRWRAMQRLALRVALAGYVADDSDGTGDDSSGPTAST